MRGLWCEVGGMGVGEGGEGGAGGGGGYYSLMLTYLVQQGHCGIVEQYVEAGQHPKRSSEGRVKGDEL